MESKFPEGKYLASVKIGPKGQIVIPKEVRDMFGLSAGDQLVLMADKGQGIALQPYAYLDAFFRAVNETKGDKNDGALRVWSSKKISLVCAGRH